LALVLVESSDEGKRARAEQLSEANVRRAPNAERAVATAAWIKFKTGSTDIADQVLGQILRGGRLEPQTAYYAAMLLKSRGMKDEYSRFLRASAPACSPERRNVRRSRAFVSVTVWVVTRRVSAPTQTWSGSALKE
ncbi:MAG: hypothetical protein ACK53L_12650, partial [Pirellulaceae bacterium]